MYINRAHSRFNHTNSRTKLIRKHDWFSNYAKYNIFSIYAIGTCWKADQKWKRRVYMRNKSTQMKRPKKMKEMKLCMEK